MTFTNKDSRSDKEDRKFERNSEKKWAIRTLAELSELDSVEEGSIKKLNISDINSAQLLSDILKELKLINIQLSIMSDNELKKTEIN